MLFNLLKFKTFFSALLVTLFMVTGCSYFFDKKEKEDEVEFSSNHADCMVASGDVLTRYFEDFSDTEKAQREIVEFGLCYQEAIESFVKFTKSGDEETKDYSAEKFESFFEKFYDQMGMSISKIKGYIEFKNYFVGGSRTSVSKDELLAVSEILPMFTSALSELAPYRSILLGKADLERNKEGKIEFYKAFSILKSVAGHLVHSLKPWEGQRSSSIHKLGDFIISEYYPDEAESKKALVEMLVSFKNLVLNERHEFLKREDMSSFVVQTIRTYEAISEFNYFVEDDVLFDSLGTIVSFIVQIPSQLKVSKKFQGEALPSLLNIIRISSDVLAHSAKRSEDGVIAVSKIRELLESMEKAKYMDGPLRASTLSNFIDEFSSKWIMSSRDNIGADIDSSKITYISSAVEEWSERQKHINSRFEGEDSISLIQLSRDTDDEGIKKWLSVFEKTALHQWLSDGRIKYSSNTSELSYEEVTVSNSIYSLVSIFMKPFSRAVNDPLKYTVQKADAQAVYNVLRILGIDMAFVDARVITSGENSFLEGNNFSTQMRSDQYLDFYEAYELMSVIFSSGIMGSKIYDGFVSSAEKGCLLDHEDVFRHKVMKADCFRKHLKENFGNYFSQLESFNNYWNSADDLTREKFIGIIEMASRGGVISKKPFDLGELRLMSGTMYYFESVFHNFDKDRSGFVKNDETFAAEEHYRTLVTEFIVNNKKDTIGGLQGLFDLIPDWMDGGQTGEQQMRDWAPAIFMYILREGKVPEGFWGTTGFLTTIGGEFRWWAATAEVKHDMVIRVFGALANTSGNGHRRKIHDFLLNNKDELYQNLSTSEVPDCRLKKELPFCIWARLMYCNEPVNKDLFHWMKSSQLLLFPDEKWEDDRELTVKEAMVDMSRFFRTNTVFSTQCGFPDVEPIKGFWEWAGDGFNDFWSGTPTEKGFWESLWGN